MIQEIYRPGDPVGDILFNWLPLLGAVALGIVGLFIIARGFRHYVNSTYLKRAGKPGQARVTKKWIKEGYVDRKERHRTKPTKHYFLRFELLDDERMLSVEEVAPVDLWNEIEVGGIVDVLFHPRRQLMRLTAWKNYSGTNAGATQMAIGAVMLSAAIAAIFAGAFSVLRGPEHRVAGENWVRDKAEVLNIGTPSDPYKRIFAPGSQMIRVVFGETYGGAMLGNERVIWVSPEQIEAFDVADGSILVAWMDPENEYNAILDLERPDVNLR